MTTPTPTFSVNSATAVPNADGWYQTTLSGLWYYHSKVNTDNRGYYSELALIPDLENVIGHQFKMQQINLARSEKNVIRGFHAEQWNKLITVTNGVAFCAIADVRPDSPTFGKVESFLLGRGVNALPGALFIANGLGNSVCVVEGPVDYLYAVDQLYRERDKTFDVAFSLFDEDLGVQWPLGREEMIISERDSNSVTLRATFPEKFSGASL